MRTHPNNSLSNCIQRVQQCVNKITVLPPPAQITNHSVGPTRAVFPRIPRYFTINEGVAV